MRVKEERRVERGKGGEWREGKGRGMNQIMHRTTLTPGAAQES